MAIFSRWMQESRRPRLACEVTAQAVVAARGAAEPGVIAAASTVRLPAGTLAPGWKEANVLAPAALADALRQALTAVSERQRNATIIVPDSCVRVLVLDFDTLPDRERDALPIVRFRLRKLLPFDADTAAVSYQVWRDGSQVKTLVAAMPQSVRAEYESAVHAAGFEPGAVLPSTLATLPLLPQDRPALLVHLGQGTATIAIVRGEAMLLHRVLELDGPRLEPGAAAAGHHEDLSQAIVVARAYFEDTLGRPPDALIATGIGSEQRLAGILEGYVEDGAANVPLRPLVGSSQFLPAAAPGPADRELYGSVAGALS